MVRTGLFIVFIWLFATSVSAQTRIVEISTNYGDMQFRLFDDTPKHRNAFVELTNQGYYDGTLFYRVIEDFLIQGGSKSSRNAPPGKRIGYGDPDKTVDDEILKHYFHKKGSLCAPRQPDEVNPFKQSDISQFFIIKGSVYTEGALDTMEMAVNTPIRNKIVQKYMTPEVRAQLKQLKEEKKVQEFRELASKIKDNIETDYNLNRGVLEFSEAQREAYTTVGGYPELDGKYTIFGECISGFDVIDKIAALKTDSNDRPFNDVKITVTVIK
ncbi:peptidylprolyl isomerase [Draconibacterium sp. IB214405]|uniref:peptidylprolyl isomerase n=1 Tax=Draconibacterium sp. IB214405 TaxID=3097352 RepID=UPI002A0E46AB|nr:peptidylprolyl isomerase [Draconibacterium sp. IB214405]MDX8341609.1 peptidylprolyl isomerase [Draconibacterium sp. IB214405]